MIKDRNDQAGMTDLSKLRPSHARTLNYRGVRGRHSKEASKAMHRITCLMLVIGSSLPVYGCALPGWYRSVGHFPGVAPSDYAFYNFMGTSSQLYQFTPSQVASSALEAMGDLGFAVAKGPEVCPDGVIEIAAQTPDGRSCQITITPQNNLSNMRIKIGPVCVGDQMLSRDLFKRVAVNFGTLPRDHTPLEPALARRINSTFEMPPPIPPPPGETLEGEGLRPGETRGAVGPEGGQPGGEAVPPTTYPSPFGFNPLLVPTPMSPFTFPAAPIPPTTYDTIP
jgi:hypothetical protein